MKEMIFLSIEPKLTINFIRFAIKFSLQLNQLLNLKINNQTQEDKDAKITKSVTFCFEKNIVHSIYKCPSEYLSKKKRKQLSRKISSSIKGKWLLDQTSSDEETKNYSDLEDYEHFYSIIEWKKLQEAQQQKMTPNNQNEDQNSKKINDFKDRILDTPKSCLKQIKKLDIPPQLDEPQQKDQIDDQQTEVCSEKNLNKDNLLNDQFIVVSKFKDHGEGEEDQISINLDDLFEFQSNYKEQKTHDRQDISIYDSLRKKIDFKSAFKIVDIVKLYENI
ncbi:unnamed protein product [Paramecium octaurelia]|uniref:Uncharacterized protein n=1 Tax=Paramecium octaurelia TaxID=43137 RepID=A0A8S1VFX2_PAROT|nr:unnamed protein product [Paramecium octaurelia]